MSYWGCIECHHEWEGTRVFGKCDWCGGKGKILEEKTPLEKMLESMYPCTDGTEETPDGEPEE